MWPYDKLSQFQFVQENEREYTLKLNGARGVYADSEFIGIFKNLLGEDAEIRIEHVNEVPVLSSGKRKHVVSKLNK
jgi:phenylacetate-CoA ligase